MGKIDENGGDVVIAASWFAGAGGEEWWQRGDPAVARCDSGFGRSSLRDEVAAVAEHGGVGGRSADQSLEVTEDWEFEVGDNVNAFVDAIMNASIDVTVDANDLEKEGFQFIVGMIFNSNDEFKWAVKCNQALRKREIKFTKIEPARITVVCKDVNCEWRMYDSKSNSNSLLSIKSYNPDHTCAVQNDIKNVNAGFLANKHQSWRAKRLAHKENNGDDHKQFELLWDYCEELRKSNPGTTAKMKVDGDFTISGRSRFMRIVEEAHPKAVDWVSSREPHHYCRAFFSSFPNCDILLNNLCESWNSSILQFRENGIMTMCENIRVYLMTKDKSTNCTAYGSKDDVYEVEDCYGRKYKVDLNQYYCSCRRWDLTGIPCSHIIAAIRRKGCIPEEYINNYYTVESYLRSYELVILPVTSSELWHKTGLPPLLPPKYKAQPGSPKRKKKRMGLAESATDQAGNKGKLVNQNDDMMNSQPSQNVGNHEPQVSNFISSDMEQLPTADNVIRKGGREYVTISTLQKKMKAVDEVGSSLKLFCNSWMLFDKSCTTSNLCTIA
nr:uncharacterized protein LOC109174707 [Ipomoea batatas]